MHEPTDHPQFNESAYYLRGRRLRFAVLIGWATVNEGHAEVTVQSTCPAAIRFDRAPIDSNDKSSRPRA